MQRREFVKAVAAGAGAIQDAVTTMTLSNCTFTSNTSVDNGEGGGPSVLDGTITPENTLLSLNSPDAGSNNIDLDASWIPLGVTGTGAFVSLGHNLISNLGTVTTPAATGRRCLVGWARSPAASRASFRQ